MQFSSIQSSSQHAQIPSISHGVDNETVSMEPVVVTQQPSSSSTVMQQPRPFVGARAVNTIEQCCVGCAHAVTKTPVCMMATGVLVMGALGGVLGTGTALMAGGSMAKGGFIGYMAGTAAGAPMGCAVQKCHDLHWQEEVNAQIEESNQASSVPPDAPTGDGAPETRLNGFANPCFVDESDDEMLDISEENNENSSFIEESNDYEELIETGFASSVLRFDDLLCEERGSEGAALGDISTLEMKQLKL